MTESDKEREEKATQIAYLQGRRDSDVDSRLRSHENRLNAINGSIRDHARSVEDLSKTVAETRLVLEGKIDALITAQATTAAVAADRAKTKLDRRTFMIGVCTVVALLITALAAVIALILTSH